MDSVQELVNLREISLAEGEVNREKQDVMEEKKSQHLVKHDNENERKLKSNSLKRFFRMPHKRKAGEEDTVVPDKNQEELTKDDINLANEIQNPTQIGDAGDFEVKINVQESKVEYKRFKLRFGGIKSNPKISESSDQDLPASFSSLTLKSSISNYWNSVFKQKKNKQLDKSNKLDDDQDNTNSTEDNENDLNFEENIEIEEADKTFVVTSKENLTEDDILSKGMHDLKISNENILE